MANLGFVALLALPLSALAEEPGQWSPTPGSEWRALDLDDVLVKPGSALDFSFLVEPGPAGKHGFMKIDPKGNFVFEKQPDKPLRFLSCSDPMEYWRPKTHEEIDTYADQVRLAGYNVWRAHFLDLMLMIETTEDGVPNPEQVDRWDYLRAALKKRGIYLNYDITTTWTGFYALPRGQAWTPEGKAVNLYGRMYWEPKAREHWAKAMRLMLTHVNPYTGTALKDDPQVVIFQLRNEAGLYFLLDHHNKNKEQEIGLIGPLREWLRKRYGSIEALNKAWAKTPGYKDFDEIPFPPRQGLAPESVDLQRFIVDKELELLTWMKGEIGKVGVRVPINDYNVGIQMGEALTRSTMSVVDAHAYHDHPSSYINPGSEQPNESAIAKGMDFVVWLNEVRQLDKAFMVSEWGYPYWNQWRYEAGLSAPAYGALQGWSYLNHSHEPIKIRTEVSPRPFSIAYDPPNKLAERMAVFLYGRGDVSPSKHAVEVRLDPEGIFTRWGGEGYMPPAVRRLTLMLRSGVRIVDFPQASPGVEFDVAASLRIHPTEKNSIVWVDEPDAKETSDEASMVASLRARGLLPQGNKTDVTKGIYQSDTGQLTLDMRNKTMLVDTPRSQAASLPAGSAPVKLSDVGIANRGDSGTFFVTALDGKPIKESSHFLVITVGDALNTGDVYKDKGRKVIEALGTFPVLVHPMRAEIVISRPMVKSKSAKLWALAFNGERVGEIPVVAKDGKIILNLDTRDFPSPVLQFELVLENTP